MLFLRLDVQNFLSFRQGTLFFQNQGLVLIKGLNQDSSVCSSNGSGKSSLIVDAWCWTLFGETARGIKGAAVIKRNSEGGCCAALSFTNGTTTWQVVRFQGHPKEGNGLKLLQFSSGCATPEDISSSDKRETQARIERLINLTKDVALLAVVLGQDANVFAALTDGEKKSVLERVLQLEQFNEAEKKARVAASDFELRASLLNGSIATVNANLKDKNDAATGLKSQSIVWVQGQEAERTKQTQLREVRLNEISALTLQLTGLESDLHNAEQVAAGATQEWQSRYDLYQMRNNELSLLCGQQQVLATSLNLLQMKQEVGAKELRIEKTRSRFDSTSLEEQRTRTKVLTRIQTLQNNWSSVATTCPTCSQPLPEIKVQQAQAHIAGQISEEKAELQRFDEITEQAVQHRAEELKRLEQEVVDLKMKIDEAHKQSTNLDAQVVEFQKQVGVLNEQVIEAQSAYELCATEARKFKAQVDAIVLQRQTKQSEVDRLTLSLNHRAENPFEEALKMVTDEITTMKSQLEVHERDLIIATTKKEQFQFWVKGFGKSGIQSYLLDNVIPFLNERLAYWTKFMWDEELVVTFKTQRTTQAQKLKEDFHIEIQGLTGPADYESCSAGERERIDLCIALALQDLVLNRANMTLNICILDEVCHYMDAEGAEAYGRILRELQRVRQTVFVITHNSSLESLLNKTWTIRKENGTSTLVAE